MFLLQVIFLSSMSVYGYHPMYDVENDSLTNAYKKNEKAEYKDIFTIEKTHYELSHLLDENQAHSLLFSKKI